MQGWRTLSLFNPYHICICVWQYKLIHTHVEPLCCANNNVKYAYSSLGERILMNTDLIKPLSSWLLPGRTHQYTSLSLVCTALAGSLCLKVPGLWTVGQAFIREKFIRTVHLRQRRLPSVSGHQVSFLAAWMRGKVLLWNKIPVERNPT